MAGSQGQPPGFREPKQTPLYSRCPVPAPRLPLPLPLRPRDGQPLEFCLVRGLDKVGRSITGLASISNSLPIPLDKDPDSEL